MKVWETGETLEYYDNKYTLIPLFSSGVDKNGFRVIDPFSIAVHSLVQITGNMWGADDNMPNPICMGRFAFLLVGTDFSSPDDPNIHLDWKVAVMNEALDDTDEIHDETGESEEGTSEFYDPEAERELMDGNLPPNIYKLDRHETPNRFQDGLRMEIEGIEFSDGEDDDRYDEEEELEIEASERLEIHLAEQLAAEGILPHMLLASLYVLSEAGDLVQLGYLVDSIYRQPVEGDLLIFNGAFLALHHAMTFGAKKAEAMIPAESQAFAKELLAFLDLMGVRTMDEYETGANLIALSSTIARSEPYENEDGGLMRKYRLS